jgi:hypothetical protein
MADYEGMMMLEPRDAFDGCILGVVLQADGMACDGMDGEGAREFFDFNILGAYVGSGTPCFLDGAACLEVGDV